MHSARSSGLSGLVRTVVLCASTQIIIEMHSRTRGAKCCTFERPAKQATESKRRSGLFFVIPVSRYSN